MAFSPRHPLTGHPAARDVAHGLGRTHKRGRDVWQQARFFYGLVP